VEYDCQRIEKREMSEEEREKKIKFTKLSKADS
jgi:hypothetical protein